MALKFKQHSLSSEVVKQNYDPNGRNKLKELAEKYGAEADEMARADGVPEGLIQLMKARRERPSYTELARKLVPVEPMPEGAVSVYYFDDGDPDD